ncbi:hypothetical protein [Falsiroseomonas sp.]|uniref:hypothetical protein n=1 Tax=Falsiroseomonas sp. TaxID=2870721 RepID=UPI003F730BDE
MQLVAQHPGISFSQSNGMITASMMVNGQPQPFNGAIESGGQMIQFTNVERITWPA